jgi:hypothetical protein
LPKWHEIDDLLFDNGKQDLHGDGFYDHDLHINHILQIMQEVKTIHYLIDGLRLL